MKRYPRYLFLSVLLFPHFLSAQQRNEEEYRKYAALVQKEVWAWDLPAFKGPGIVTADSNASAVIPKLSIRPVKTGKSASPVR